MTKRGAALVMGLGVWSLLMSSARAEPEKVEAEVEKRPALSERFSSSRMLLRTSTNLNTLFPSLQSTRNPSAVTSVALLPRLRLDHGFLLGINAGLSVEWTNSDFTQSLREPLLNDTSLVAFYSGLPRWLGVRTIVGLGLTLPTSKFSQARTMRAAPSVTLMLQRPISGVLGGSLFVSVGGNYQHAFFASTTPGLVDDIPYDRACFGGSTTCLNQASGLANVPDQVSWNASVAGSWGPITPSLFFQMAHQFPFGFDALDGVAPFENRGDVRQFTTFLASVNWAVTDWFGAEVGYQMWRNLIGGSGRYENPIFDRHEDMRLYVGFNVTASFLEPGDNDVPVMMRN